MSTLATILSLGLLASSLPQAVPKMSEGVYAVPLKRIRNQAAYGIDLRVDNPPQPVTVLADTGSNTYSFESPG